MVDVTKKNENMIILSEYYKKLVKNPQLRVLFLELTLKCNLKCFHCGSGCDLSQPEGLPLIKYKEILDDIKENFGTNVFIAITGGEPLLYEDFFELTSYISKSGFRWGMTTNGTLISNKVAHELNKCGMRTVSVSIDGVEETHDKYRGLKGSFSLALQGIQNLIDENEFKSIMVTSVINHENVVELNDLFKIINKIDVDNWRLTGLEPIGRAMNSPDLLLTSEDYIHLLDFIKEKRNENLPIKYSCCHFLGEKYEAEVRDWYFLCNAGVYVASIMQNGDIGACLDIPRNELTIQGNVFKDSFTDVWKNKFEIFRRPLSDRNQKCRECLYAKFCRGGSYHSWDYDDDYQKVCLEGTVF